MFSYSVLFFFFKQKTAYEMRISDWSSDVCSSDLLDPAKITGLYSTRRYKMSDLDRLASRAAIQDLYSDKLIAVDKRQEGRLAYIWWDDAEWNIEGIGTYKGPEGALSLEIGRASWRDREGEDG